MTASTSEDERPRFAIFRSKDAQSEAEMTVMAHEEFSPIVADGALRAQAAGMREGSELKLLAALPGFSLVYVWFKSGFPLPRHSHNVDCLYYIIAGSLKIGHDELGAGDSFFIGKDAPYAYTPGADGVEVLEFRAADAFNIKILADNPAFWDKAVETARSHRSAWATERRPGSVMGDL